MQRILAISDIHGEIEKFERLLQISNYNPQNDQLILMGDYIDRGTNSKAVVDEVMELKKEGAIVLKGNHEDYMVRAFMLNDELIWEKWTKRNGGDQTLKCYGLSAEFETRNEEKPSIFNDHFTFLAELDCFRHRIMSKC